MLKRIIASVGIGVVLIGGGLVAPAQASRQARSNTGGTVATRGAWASTTARLANLKVFATPVLAYTSKTCVINLNAIPDLTVVNSVTGCGVKVHFSVPMQKRTVPAGGWAAWGSPPNTETSTPKVLWTQSGVTQVVLTYSATKRIVGVEADPEAGSLHTIKATFRRLSGSKIGTISRDVNGFTDAKLFAGKVKSTAKSARVKTLTLSSDDDFAIARIRIG